MTLLQDQLWCDGKILRIADGVASLLWDTCLPTPLSPACQSIDLPWLSSSITGVCKLGVCAGIPPSRSKSRQHMYGYRVRTERKIFPTGEHSKGNVPETKSTTAELLATPWVKKVDFGV